MADDAEEDDVSQQSSEEEEDEEQQPPPQESLDEAAQRVAEEERQRVAMLMLLAAQAEEKRKRREENERRIRDAYLDKATIAYHSREYKLCMVLMKSVSLTDSPSVKLLVRCAYEFWKTTQEEVGEGEEVEVKWEKSREQEEVVEIVKGAYTQLLGEGDRSLVTGFQYVQLSHIYIAEAALSGALRILQLAQARGHLENTLVVLQCWSLLKRLKGQREAELCMNFLVTSVTLEDRNEPDQETGTIMLQDSNLPLAYAYLLCASHLRRRAIASHDEQVKRRDLDICWNMLAEAYQVFTQETPGTIPELIEWFNDAKIFFEMGRYLSKTPFLLIAEDSYWEAFLRAPLEDAALESMTRLMRQYKRGHKDYIKELVELAYQNNPWNMFVRRWLVSYENDEKVINRYYDPHYTRHFELDRQHCSKLQGYMRGYLLRNVFWPAIYARAKKKRDEFLSKVEIAEKKYAITFVKNFRALLRLWQENAKDLKELRRESSTRIQTAWRRCWGLIYYRKRTVRAIRANYLFMQASQFSYEMQRVRALRKWEKVFRDTIHARAATILVRTLLANGYSAVMGEAMEKILGVIRVMRTHSNKIVWEVWRTKYKYRQKKHAWATIRFFVRGTMIRVRERIKEEAMAAAKKRVETIALASTHHILPLYRHMWDIWREELQKKREAKARVKVAKMLPRVYARIKAKKVYQKRRVMLEIHFSMEQIQLFKRVGTFLISWQRGSAVRKIQRMMRIRIAKRVVRRQRHIVHEMARRKAIRDAKTCRRIWWRWLKYLFLRSRKRHSMAWRIVKFFRRLVRFRKIIWASRRKPRAYRLLMAFHFYHLRQNFRKAASGVTNNFTLRVLGPLFLSRWRQCIRVGFQRWRRWDINQVRIEGLMKRLIYRRSEKRFWPHAYETCEVNHRVICTYDDWKQRQMDPKTGIVFGWEHVLAHPERKYSLRKNMRMFNIAKAFTAWTCSYRLKNRVRRSNLGSGLISDLFVSALIRKIFRRTRLIITLQCAWRIYSAKKRFRLKAHHHGRMCELHFRIEAKPRWRLLTWIHKMSVQRRRARWMIQCAWRQAIARRKADIRRVYYRSLRERELHIARNSRSAMAILARYSNRMQILYVMSLTGAHAEGILTTAETLRSRIAFARNGIGLANGNGKGKKVLQLKQQSGGGLGKAGSRPGKMGSSLPLEFIGQVQMRGKLVGNNNNSIVSSSTSASSSSSSLQSVSKMLSSMHSAQSPDFHGQIFRLRQTGIFIFESLQRGMSPMEVQYCLQSCQIVFCQIVRTEALQQVFASFTGSKLVLCGGGLTLRDMFGLLGYIGDRTDAISVHFSDTAIPFAGVIAFVQCLGAPSSKASTLVSLIASMGQIQAGSAGGSDASVAGGNVYSTGGGDGGGGGGGDSGGPGGAVALMSRSLPAYPPTTHNRASSLPFLPDHQMVPLPPIPTTFGGTSFGSISMLRELSVDSNSFGGLGIALVLMNMRNNTSIEILIVKCGPHTILPCYGKCFRSMHTNTTLVELRIFGIPLGVSEVEGLFDGVKSGLRGLVLLEFSATKEALPVSDRIIDLAKDRLYAGRGGLSVSVI